MTTYIEAVWNLMIANGGAIDTDKDYQLGSYYSSVIEYDKPLTRKIFSLLEKGILPDYNILNEPQQDQVHRFNGTFTSSQLKINYLYGDLILQDGTSAQWALQIDSSTFGFSDVLKMILDAEKMGAEAAINSLGERLSGTYW